MFSASSLKLEADCEFKPLSQRRSTVYCMFQQLRRPPFAVSVHFLFISMRINRPFWVSRIDKLRCNLGHNPLLPIRPSSRRVVVGVNRMSQHSQIERLKFGRFRNKRLMLSVPVTCSDNCEY